MPNTGMTRRQILTAGCGVALAGSTTGCSSKPVMAPEKKIIALYDLNVNAPIRFTYPGDEIALLLDVGQKVEGGVGPRESIIAFSGLCQHMGCPVNYKTDQGHFICPCHDSEFDALHSGNTVDGPSPTKLPRILLKVVQRKVYAIGVHGGVIYGRAFNKT